ncbi:MAG TPA: ABC transporter permease [Blastocatellia bacterium]|jgi:putative ABC transport system permease protein|nr:ABC transporter permease [Blastocatellia bacterium]
MMDNLLKDVRYGVRHLLKNRGFTVVAVTALALGIGANTAIFSVVNAVLLRSLPYPGAERLVTIRSNQSLLDFVDIEAQTQSFEQAGAFVLQAFDYTGGSEPVQVQAALIDTGLFEVLGAQIEIGRTLPREEDRFGGDRLVVVGRGFWQRHLGGGADVLGKTIPLSGNNYTVVGVLASTFTTPLRRGGGADQIEPEVFVSLRVGNPVAASFRGVHFLRTFWRLKSDVTIAQAQSEMEVIDQRLAEQYPEENKGRRRVLVPLKENLVGDTRPFLLLLFGAVGLVLLIACANFANLLLAQAASRHREIAVRSALGAGRARLVRQMLTESVLVAIMGGTAGLLLALWGISLLVALKPANLPRISGVGIDGPVLLFTLVVSVVTGILFGLVPAWSASRADLNEALKEGGRSASGGVSKRRLRSVLVVAELAISLVVLIAAGLLIRSFWQLRSTDPGFDPRGVVTMRIELPESRYREIPKQNQFRTQVLDELNSLPGVEAALISELPLGGDWLTHNFIIDGRAPLAPGDEPEISTRSATRGYFKAMRIPLVGGRDFTTQDRVDALQVCILNQSAVREYFRDENPIGARIRWARGNADSWMMIVGVVGDIKHFELGQPEQPAVYTAYEQQDQPWKRWMSVVIRSNSGPSTLTDQAKKAVWAVDSQVPLTRVQTMAEVMAASIAEQRFNMLLLGIFAAVALLLASVGVYGVISYSVTQRTHEIGIRMALGARTGSVLKLVVGEGLRLAAVGVGLGLAAAFALTRLMSTFLFGVSATDPQTFVLISIVLVAVALLASYIPARRATKVDPMVALRCE